MAKLSIETSNDLFEMDASVTTEAVLDFKARRKEWPGAFGEALRQLFESRIAGNRRKGRRPDPEQSFRSLRVLSDTDARKQGVLGELTRNLTAAAKEELEALDLRVAVLFDEPPSLDTDNPFAPAYLLDAIGMTSRSLYAEPQIWRSVMERVITDFIPAISKVYIPLNRLLAERGVLPDAGAIVRARSYLHPRDDAEVLPLFDRLINDVHPSLQAWRTLDPHAARAASYHLLPLAANPYASALATTPTSEDTATADPNGFPRLNAMMSRRELQPVLEMLDRWQRADPMAEHLRDCAPDGIDATVTPVNRIPWIQAAIGAQVANASGRNSIDVVGFLFDYIIRDIAIPPRLRLTFDGLQLPILKVALADPAFFAGKLHPARRLINDLADASIGADDDANYGAAVTKIASRIVDTIRTDFGIDARVFENACHTLREFTEGQREEVAVAMQPQIEAAASEESRDVDRSQVRALVRNRLAGTDIPGDVRAFSSTVWASYLKQVRQTEGPDSASYASATQTLDDLLWSITVKARTGQRARLSRMIPSLIGRLREGGASVHVTGEKMKRFLDVLYELHVAAIRPEGFAKAESMADRAAEATDDSRKNVFDLAIDAVRGTWFAFDKGNGTWLHARLDWISPMRTTYILAGRARGETIVVTPEDLAWEMSNGRASLVAEPVPLYDRAISAALDFLAARGARRDEPGGPAHSRNPTPEAAMPSAANF
ncbi:MAG: DUF1631 family protein [Casimicrobiaceae bacterium]